MMANNNIQDTMNNEEINGNENKKIWIAPELEVLDGRKTFSGKSGGQAEDEAWEEWMGEAYS